MDTPRLFSQHLSSFESGGRLSKSNCDLTTYPLVHVGLCCASRLEDALGFGHLFCRAVCHNEEFVGFDRRLVLQDTVLGNTNAV